MATKLSVNLNKVALIRNSRGANLPDLVQIAKDCEHFGAQGITLHPRPDQRHARYSDIETMKAVVSTELNIEGNPIDKFMNLVLEYQPDQCTLVPDAPDALTSDAGWDTITHRSRLSDICNQLREAGIRSSLFVDPDPRMVEGAKDVGVDRIEFYTGPYAYNYAKNKESALLPYSEAAKTARNIGLDVNAGHDLNLDNLNFFISHIPWTKEVSIGHALICDALYYGLSNTIKMYLNEISRKS